MSDATSLSSTHKTPTMFTSAAEEAQSRLHVEIIPGTEILTDLEDTHFIRGGRQGVVLVPQPTVDPHDPLNWSPFWKYITLLNCSLYMFLGNFTALSIAPLTPIYLEYFNTTITRVGLLTGVCVLTLGYANFILIPCTCLFGRRPVALVCSVVFLGSNVWQALATSYSSLMGGRALIGIAAATSESLMPVVIADLLFLHERGTWMGIYFWAFFMGAWAGPIVSGNIAANPNLGWRWFFWVSAIIQGVLLISMFFFFPETKYQREPSVTTYQHHNREDAIDTGDMTTDTKEEATRRENIEALEVPTPTTSVLGKGYPTKTQRLGMNLRPDRAELKFLPRDLITPFQLVAFPIVIFGSCCLGFGANCLLVLNLLESPGFSAPPYNFSPSAVGFVNFALMGGGIFGLLTAGPFSDWVSMKLTIRNNGIREPEMRLPALIPFCIIGFIGLLVAGLGWEHQWPWPVIVVVGFGFSGVLVMAIPTIGLTYAIDSYKPVAGQITVVGTVVKNTFGFGMTYFINDMANQRGYLVPVMLLASLGVGIPIVGGVMLWFWGKSCRRISRNSKVHRF